MKKIIALAVATAISAPAMADLTISGTVAAGWSGSTAMYSTAQDIREAELNTTAGTAALKSEKGSSGFGIDTAGIKLAGSETTESGLTVAGYMTAGGLTRSTGIAGENAELSVAGGFGKLAITNSKGGAYTESYGPADNFVGEFGTEGVSDTVAYTLPALMDGMVTLVVDTGDAGGVGKGDSDYDMQGTALIKAGAFSGRVAYKVVDNGSNRVRVGGTFDAGVVKLAAAYQNQDGAYEYTSGGVVVPMGATTLGLSFAQKKTDTTKLEGMSVGVSHALSSNVTVSAKANKFDTNESAGNVLVTLAF